MLKGTNSGTVPLRIDAMISAHLKTHENGLCVISSTLGGFKSDHIHIPGHGKQEYLLGKWHISQPGYQRLELRGISKSRRCFPEISEIIISGSAVDHQTVFVKDNEGSMFYWGRRGPSIHLNYDFGLRQEENMEFFYSEVTVPKGYDQIGAFFMACGFAEGYFGIQVNSEEERKVLFSIWSPCQTDDPTCIPEDLRVRCHGQGDGVTVCEFGCEGSGGQSFLRYPWQPDTPYKFLVRARPYLIPGSTIFSAYFFAPELGIWLLIAKFSRPCTQTWLQHSHSFMENFIPEAGHIERKAYYHNQWVRTSSGEWKSVKSAKFTGDDTARRGYRDDFDGGVEEGRFFLRHCGFFDGKTKQDTVFEIDQNNDHPKIDFKSLEA